MPPLTPPWLLPPDEGERLRSLRRCAVLPASQEAVFQELAQLAALLFDLPIALIALVAADEVVYQASEGWPNLTRQARAEAICALVVKHNKPVVLTDLTQPAQQQSLATAAAAAVQAKGLQFYAGVPLRAADQRPIGTFCVLGRQPREFSLAEQEVLAQFARLVERLLAVRHACLTSGQPGQARWPLVQARLGEEVRELTGLVRYLLTRYGAQVPTEPAVLEAAGRRLDQLGQGLEEGEEYD